MKNVVYIIGSGATQAEVSYARPSQPMNLTLKSKDALGPGISERVLNSAEYQGGLIKDRLNIEEETDIEKLITLLSATGSKENKDCAAILREKYCSEIVKGLSQAEVLEKPLLAISLLQMHKIKDFSKIEDLKGIISLNHDNLFQQASKKIYNGVNLGFNFSKGYFDRKIKSPIIIQLHGSFNWLKGNPIQVDKLDPDADYTDEDMIWIPPTILKETKEYPFNKLNGLAFELLADCDILRIVGCSLSQNDWNLISLLFNAQDAQKAGSDICFNIELIMNNNLFKEENSYLRNIIPFNQLEVIKYSGHFDGIEDGDLEARVENPFEFWIRAKAKYHISKDHFKTNKFAEPLKEIIGK